MEVPEEYGGNTWEDGTSALNYKPVAQCEKDSDGYYFAYELWDSVREMNKTPLQEDWSRVMQAESTRRISGSAQHDDRSSCIFLSGTNRDLRADDNPQSV